MFCRHVGITFFAAAIVAGCVSAPREIESENAVDIDGTNHDGPVTDVNYLGGARPEGIRRCRKEASTGTYVKRIVCGPKRDDRNLLEVIASPPHY